MCLISDLKNEFCLNWTFGFQLHVAISQNENLEQLGLGTGSSLVTRLKKRVVSLASNSGVISTVQMAAQSTLQNGWSILLPTAEERARALSSLLSSGGKGSVAGLYFYLQLRRELGLCLHFSHLEVRGVWLVYTSTYS